MIPPIKWCLKILTRFWSWRVIQKYSKKIQSYIPEKSLKNILKNPWFRFWKVRPKIFLKVPDFVPENMSKILFKNLRLWPCERLSKISRIHDFNNSPCKNIVKNYRIIALKKYWFQSWKVPSKLFLKIYDCGPDASSKNIPSNIFQKSTIVSFQK